jgi:hypothetical protein
MAFLFREPRQNNRMPHCVPAGGARLLVGVHKKWIVTVNRKIPVFFWREFTTPPREPFLKRAPSWKNLPKPAPQD